MRKNVTPDLHTCVKMVPSKNVNIKQSVLHFPLSWRRINTKPKSWRLNLMFSEGWSHQTRDLLNPLFPQILEVRDQDKICWYISWFLLNIFWTWQRGSILMWHINPREDLVSAYLQTGPSLNLTNVTSLAVTQSGKFMMISSWSGVTRVTVLGTTGWPNCCGGEGGQRLSGATGSFLL